MADSQINDYIKKQREVGVSDEAIQKAMISSGWPEDQVKHAFSPVSEEDFGGKLLGPGALLSKSFSLLKSRFWTLIGIQVIPILIAFVIGVLVAIVVGVFAAAGLGQNIAAMVVGVIVAIVLFVALLYLFLWSQVAVFQAIINADERIGIKEAFRRSKSKIGAFWWVSLLESLVVMGGFLLLIIPGIIFATWFMFGNILYVDQGIKGLAALSKSREYVRGIFWSIFGRMAAFFIPFIIFYAVMAGVMESSEEIGPMISIIANITSSLFGLLFTIYAVLLYKNVKSLKGETVNPGGTGWIKALAIWGIVGFIIIPVGASLILIAINPTEQIQKAQDIQQRTNVLAIQSALTLYYTEMMEYPQILAELVPTFISEVPKTPSGEEYQYTVTESGYELCAPVIDMSTQNECVTQETSF